MNDAPVLEYHSGQYDEDGVHMCSVYFRKNAFTDSDEYTKQEHITYFYCDKLTSMF